MDPNDAATKVYVDPIALRVTLDNAYAINKPLPTLKILTTPIETLDLYLTPS